MIAASQACMDPAVLAAHGEKIREALATNRREWREFGGSWQAFCRLKAGDTRVLRTGTEDDQNEGGANHES